MIGIILILGGCYFLYYAKKKQKEILLKAENDSEQRLYKAENKAEKLIKEAEDSILPYEERIERLKQTDKEIVERLKYARKIIENITDVSNQYASELKLFKLRYLGLQSLNFILLYYNKELKGSSSE